MFTLMKDVTLRQCTVRNFLLNFHMQLYFPSYMQRGSNKGVSNLSQVQTQTYLHGIVAVCRRVSKDTGATSAKPGVRPK